MGFGEIRQLHQLRLIQNPIAEMVEILTYHPAGCEFRIPTGPILKDPIFLKLGSITLSLVEVLLVLGMAFILSRTHQPDILEPEIHTRSFQKKKGGKPQFTEGRYDGMTLLALGHSWLISRCLLSRTLWRVSPAKTLADMAPFWVGSSKKTCLQVLSSFRFGNDHGIFW